MSRHFALCALSGLTLGGCVDLPHRESLPRVTANVAADGVALAEGGRPVLFYRSVAEPDRERWRVNYLHPLHSISGAVITEDGPADHPHQRGVFWAWRRIIIDGVRVADGWVGERLMLEVGRPEVREWPDGSAQIEVDVRWLAPVNALVSPIIEERSSIRAYPVSEGRRRLEIVVSLRALRPGVQLAGSDDDKGYGGVSVRLAHADRMRISSGGHELRATSAAMQTGPLVEFLWPDATPPWPARITATCKVDGRSWASWVLRQEPSMQNCAFPGSTPVSVPTRHSLSIAQTLWIE